jgi:hypothetical protein
VVFVICAIDSELDAKKKMISDSALSLLLPRLLHRRVQTRATLISYLYLLHQNPKDLVKQFREKARKFKFFTLQQPIAGITNSMEQSPSLEAKSTFS